MPPKKTTRKKGSKRTKKAGATKAPAKGRGNTDGDTLYLGIRNIRRKTWDAVRARAAKDGTNAGTVISDACDAYLK